ncbi:thiaminase II [Stygiolobus caldivivus]|uniref:Thiaminase II n=1 Tax=Stygiolobus caldivivus TaxID=2824673 RepID=A0A8D5ZGL5_9CREN|nr:thiaminase II [Stygiolobus caldivivus]BCU71053.1 thiaminase II [Stygiolobus caldivivus]
MSRSQVLWDEIKDIYQGILSHPFIQGLTDGTLEEEKFKYYIVQDYHYLKSFSRALAVLSAKALEQEQTLLFATHITHAMEVEKELHKYFFSEWKIDPEKVEISPTNLLYTSYITSVVFSRPYYEGVSAVLPCYWIYMEVGKELVKKGSPNKLYQRWIETYGGEEYEKGVKAVIDIVNSFELTHEQELEVKRHFRLASMFEFMFWDSAYKMEKFPFKL